jgi:hypothetical protein
VFNCVLVDHLRDPLGGRGHLGFTGQRNLM